MGDWSRRDWFKSGLGWAASMIPTSFAALGNTCRKDETATASSGIVDRSTNRRHRDKGAADIDPDFVPAYLPRHKSGELRKRATQLWNVMKECELCPRQCGANRLKGEKGICQATSRLEISSYNPHFGEERPLVGRGGSGTIFLTHCGLRCVFCINWQVSQGDCEPTQTIEGMAVMMLHL